MRDADVDFANEYEHYELLERDDHSVPTATGHRRTIYSVGPGLLWIPFFVAADGVAATLLAAGMEADTSGYGPLHLNAVAPGSFGYGIAALFLIHAFLRRHYGDRLAGGATLLLWWASFFPWYLAQQALTSHPASVLLVAAFFLLRQRDALASHEGSLMLGLLLGLAMCVRWQSGVYLLLPAVDLLIAWRGRDLPGMVKKALLIGAGVFIGALPQLLAWKEIYGDYLLLEPPQGADFLRFDRPFLLNTLFSSRHGLLSWTPVFWFCLIGLAFATRRHPRRFGILWAPLIIMTYVNAATGDWWAGGSFSNRRFDSLFPIFAIGLAAFLQAANAFIKRHPSSILAAFVLGGAAWNLPLTRAFQLGEATPKAPLTVAARTLASSRALAHDVGSPLTWPASWIFAARYDASPAAYDLSAGKYLFYRQTNLGGVVDIGGEGDADAAMILDGFSASRQPGGTTYRGILSTARLIVSLDLPEPLSVSIEARSAEERATKVEVLLNGVGVGGVSFQPDLAIAPTVVAIAQASWWSFGIDNVLAATLGGGGLLYGAPLLWAGYLGLFGLWRKEPGLAHLALAAVAPGTLALLITTGAGDVPARTATWLPFLLPGIAHCFRNARAMAERHPGRLLVWAGDALVLWNALFMEQYRRRLLPSDDTVSFAQVTSNSAALFSRFAGTPSAWPANWIFAWRYDVSPDMWDAVAGRDIFPTPDATTSFIEIGDDPSPFGTEAPLLLEGFGMRRTCEQGWCREFDGSARILLPLQNTGIGDLEIRVRARGEGALSVVLNGVFTSVSQTAETLSDVSLSVPAKLVRPGINVLSLQTAGSRRVAVDRLILVRDLGVVSAR